MLDILILTGSGSHCWAEITRSVDRILTATGRFRVELSHSPPQDASDEEWNAWRPRFADYAAVVNLYEGRHLPEATQRDFDAFIRSGHGMLVLHSGVCIQEDTHQTWPAYYEMLGLGWLYGWGSAPGDRLIFDEEGGLVRMGEWEGVGPGHGKLHTFQIRNRQPDHPIMRGIPELFMHGMDEMFHGVRGPAENTTILASAYSAKEHLGSGDHEPMIWATLYDGGRVVASSMGHRFYDEHVEFDPPLAEHLQAETRENGADALHCVGVQLLVARAVEWVATGKVSIAVPEPFPGPDAPLVLEPEVVSWSI